jgi:hypothetical protein
MPYVEFYCQFPTLFHFLYMNLVHGSIREPVMAASILCAISALVSWGNGGGGEVAWGGGGTHQQQFWVVLGRFELYVYQWRWRINGSRCGGCGIVVDADWWWEKIPCGPAAATESFFIGAVWWEEGNRGLRSGGSSGEWIAHNFFVMAVTDESLYAMTFRRTAR